ncbi:oligosaccharide flippase family protein [Bhargavaea beijingensis]|uniref:oligosaccharide flippase family protein n=1 Tax=Bhargavaea beijingensis TaxID=426756 RepID=UPI0022245301|nr:oligosaccharide flippase family protein [Bhargavaea beijingensis]MCW1929096.1 oligosaccharide flippase family protein [Bhargavaea beijingensis]
MSLKNGVYLSFISILVTNLTNIILTPFIIRSLGQSDYGLYALIGAFVGYLAILDFGLGTTITRFIAKYRTKNDILKQENLLFLVGCLYLVFTTLLTIIGIIITFQLGLILPNLDSRELHDAKIMFIILVISLGLTLPMNLFNGVISAYERFVFQKNMIIIRTLLRALLVFILLSIGYKALAIVLIDALLNITLSIIYAIYVLFYLKLRIKFHYFDMTFIKSLLKYSFFIFVSVIVDQIYWRIGHLILGIKRSTEEVAVFAVGMTLTQYLIVFSTAISGVFLPRITRMIVSDSSSHVLTEQMIKIGRIQFGVLGLIFSAFFLLGKDFIYLWAGPGYEQSWLISMLIMTPLLLVLTQTLGITILQAKNLHGFRALSYLAISLVNAYLSIRLVDNYGVIGVALGTTLSLIIGNLLVMNIYYHRKVKLNMITFYFKLFKGWLISLLLSSFLGYIIIEQSNTWFELLFYSLTYIIIYVTISWLIGMNLYEKNLFKGELLKVKKVITRK